MTLASKKLALQIVFTLLVLLLYGVIDYVVYQAYSAGRFPLWGYGVLVLHWIILYYLIDAIWTT